MNKKILVVDDEPSIREFFHILFKKMSDSKDYSFEVVSAEDGAKALTLIQNQSFDMVISDLKMPHLSGIDLLKKIRPLYPDLIFIIITAFDTSQTAVESMKLGAYDYIFKPFNVEKIKCTILEALKLQTTQINHPKTTKELTQSYGVSSLVGQSAVMKKIFTDIKKLAPSNSNILITGESGTGKEVIARAIHQESLLHKCNFIAVNCGAIPSTLFESEMFGHKKGSFTGAHIDKKGFFELANGGSLFLDEIGELPIFVQPKMLRSLQEKTIKMVGGLVDKKVKVRLISATNRDLEQMVSTGEFREDLFYRLNVIRIHIPPLRERKEDIILFINHFLKKYSLKLNTPIKTLSEESFNLFKNYYYPGNIRELENLIERIMILSEGITITNKHILPILGKDFFVNKKIKNSDFNSLSLPESGMDLETVLGDLEKKLLTQALQKTQGSKKQAAALLQLPLRALRYRLQKYQLDDSTELNNESE